MLQRFVSSKASRVKILTDINTRIRAADREHHAIFKGMAWVVLFMLVGKVIGAGKEMVVAYRYGVGAEVDAYIFALNFILWPISVWYSVLTVVLVPMAAKLKQGSAEDLSRFRAELLGATLVLSLVLSVMAWIAISLAAHSSWTVLPPDVAALAAHATLAFTLLVPAGMLVSLLSAWMLAAGRHVNTLLEGVPPLIIAAAVLMLSGGGIEPLVWGTVAGALLQLTSLAIPLVRNNEIEAPKFSIESNQWSWFRQGFGIMLAGQILMSFNTIIDQFFAVQEGSGALATLSYANRILALLLGLGATAISRATLPVFSQVHAQSQGGEQLHRVALYWVRLLFILGLLALIVGWLLAPAAVKLLFERGAFTAGNTKGVAEVLRYGLGQLPFYFAALVLISYASSQGRYVLLFWSGVIGILSKIIANLVLVPHFGINGIALSSVFVAALNAQFFWFALRHQKWGT